MTQQDFENPELQNGCSAVLSSGSQTAQRNSDSQLSNKGLATERVASELHAAETSGVEEARGAGSQEAQ